MTKTAINTSTTSPMTQAQPGVAHKEDDAAPSSHQTERETSTQVSMPTLEELGFTDPAIASVLEACEAKWAVSERMDTEVVFVRGAVVAEAQKVCGDQKQVDAWSKSRLKVTRRAAANYVRVHRELGDRAERFIAARVGPTVMYKLAGAEAEKVEAVLRRYEDGGSMTAQEVAAFVNQANAEIASEEEPAELAGADGIRQLVREKLQVTVPDIMQHLQFILAACLVSLDEHHRGVQVKKDELVKQIEHEARIVRGKLENLVLPVASNAHGRPWVLHPERPSDKTPWGKLVRLLVKLGGKADWGKPLGLWLIDEVIPALEWGLGSKLAEAVRTEDAKRLEAIREAKEAARKNAKAERSKTVKRETANGKAKREIAAPAMETPMPDEEPAAKQPKAEKDATPVDAVKAAKPKGPKRPTLSGGLSQIAEAAELISSQP